MLGQTFFEKTGRGIEVVVVVDGPHDELSFLDREFAVEKVELKAVRLETNSGVSHAREIGLHHSTGDIVVFLDSDVMISRDYLFEHYLRNLFLSDSIFVSFKLNVPSDFQNTFGETELSLDCPDYSKDLRMEKVVSPSSIGIYEVRSKKQVNILEETNYFKDFHGSRVFGVYDLASMITGHNFSSRRELFLKSRPFSRTFKGWGMEDVYLGLKVISEGAFIIPVLSSGVYHIEHPVRSGSSENKESEYRRNSELIRSFMELPANRDA